MAYQNPYNYQPYQQFPTMQSVYSPAVPSSGINWVSGESGAKSWIVGRGETVVLMDSEAQSFYIKSADASGMPLPLRIFDYAERAQNSVGAPQTAVNHASDNFITREEFEALRSKYEELERQIKKPSIKKKEVGADE